MGELLYLSASATTTGSAGNAGSAEALLVDAMRRFARSIELCDNYLRGLYGLKIVSSRCQWG